VRRLISTLVLVVVLAGLGGYIYFVENKKPATGADTKAKAFEVQADQIDELQVAVADGDRTRAQRGADKKWKLVEPVEAEGDNSELTNMASNLASLDVERVVDENPADLKQFGLEPPRIEIGFRAKGQAEQRLLVGDKTPTGGDVYVKKPGEKKVFLVSSSVEDTFNRRAFDLRDKTILRFDRDKVKGLEITHDGTTLEFSRKAANWSIVKPMQMRADYAAIEGLITSLSATLMSKFVGNDATPAELRTYGLDRPSATATVMTDDGRATIVLGRTENAETYAKEASRPQIVMVAPTIVADLNKPLAEYRRKDLFDARSFSTKRIEVKRGAEAFVFEKTMDKDGKETWRNAAGKTVDSAKVEDLLTKRSNLRAETFEDRVDPALKMPALAATINFGESKGENRMETVTVARSGASIVASRPDEPGAFKLEGTMPFDDVMKALDALK
jgi:hypothetical protein